MISDDVLNIFKQVGGYITDSHIVYTSGRHGEAYLNKDAIYPYTDKISTLCLEIARKYKEKPVDVVVGPALGGIILSQWTAFHLSSLKGSEVLGVYTEKTQDKDQIFTRGYQDKIKGRNVLIAEDITTTGGSVGKVLESVKKAGGKTTGICVLVNRDPVNINDALFGVPFISLARVNFTSWPEKECPLCKNNVEINITVGKGREYLLSKQK